MATWVKMIEVMTFPKVIKKYHKINSFEAAAQLEAATNKAWARAEPGTASGGAANIQVDVTAIPGIPAMTDNGNFL